MKKIAFALIVILGLGLCCQANASAGPSAACAAPSAKAPKAKTAVVTFKTSIRCHNCVKKITENISFEKGVKDLSVSLDSKTVKITYDPSKTDEATLAKALEKLGYRVEQVTR